MKDVIVVGAGPAGNMAALSLAGSGHRVTVLDWRRTIGDKLCTGIIGKECVERFPPDEKQVYRKARAATVVSPEGRRYGVAREDVQAFIIDRVAYVDSIACRAMEAGADYMLGRRVTAIETDRSGVTVTAVGESGRHVYRAEMVIVAGGFGSPLLDMVGLADRGNRHFLMGVQEEVEAESIDETEVHLGSAIAPGSFGWVVPVSEDRALVGILSREKLNGHLDRFMDSLRSTGKVRGPTGSPRRWGIPLKPLRRTYADRVMVVGDAAGLVKPTTGGGIYYALRSGEIAGDAAARAFSTGDFTARMLKRYQDGWQALFGSELATGYSARLLYESLDDRQIERLLGKFLSPDVQEELIRSRDFSFDWHSGLIFRLVGHRDLNPIFRSLGPALTPLLLRLGVARLV